MEARRGGEEEVLIEEERGDFIDKKCSHVKGADGVVDTTGEGDDDEGVMEKHQRVPEHVAVVEAE